MNCDREREELTEKNIEKYIDWCKMMEAQLRVAMALPDAQNPQLQAFMNLVKMEAEQKGTHPKVLYDNLQSILAKGGTSRDLLENIIRSNTLNGEANE